MINVYNTLQQIVHYEDETLTVCSLNTFKGLGDKKIWDYRTSSCDL